MIQDKDKRSWNKEIPFSIVSTIRSECRIKKSIRKETNKKGLETTQKMRLLKDFFLLFESYPT